MPQVRVPSGTRHARHARPARRRGSGASRPDHVPRGSAPARRGNGEARAAADAAALAEATAAVTSARLIQHAEPARELPIWREYFALYDWLLLHASTTYFGLGVPQGDGSAVVTVPGFLGTDAYLFEFRAWLSRVGYRPYQSSIGVNADCPNSLLKRLLATVARAHAETGKRVHLVGHSLGGVLARSAGAHRPDLVASVTTLGSPFRGIRSHPIVLRTHDVIRRMVFGRPDGQYLPSGCYTGACTCAFVEALDGFPSAVRELAIYSRSDGIVDWRMCVTGDASKDREVLGTHVGLAFNPFVYRILAEFLAGSRATAHAT